MSDDGIFEAELADSEPERTDFTDNPYAVRKLPAVKSPPDETAKTLGQKVSDFILEFIGYGTICGLIVFGLIYSLIWLGI